MAVNFINSANKFKEIQQSSEPLYIAIERDEKNCFTGCKTTPNRNERSSLIDINEFANICFNQFRNSESTSFIDSENIATIRSGLKKIHKEVEKKDRNCFQLLWFWLFDYKILARTNELVNQLADIIPKARAKKAYDRAKNYEKSGENISDALANYKNSAIEGYVKSYEILISKYENCLGKDAACIHFAAARQYYVLKDREKFINAAYKSFDNDPKGTLIKIILNFHLDIETLFTREQIKKVIGEVDLATAYLGSAEWQLKHDELDTARELCKIAARYDSKEAQEMLETIASLIVQNHSGIELF